MRYLFPPGSGACPERSVPTAQACGVQRVRGDGQGPRPPRSGRTGHDHSPIPLSSAITDQENKHPSSIVRPSVMRLSHAMPVMRITNKTVVMRDSFKLNCSISDFVKSCKFYKLLNFYRIVVLECDSVTLCLSCITYASHAYYTQDCGYSRRERFSRSIFAVVKSCQILSCCG